MSYQFLTIKIPVRNLIYINRSTKINILFRNMKQIKMYAVIQNSTKLKKLKQ